MPTTLRIALLAGLLALLSNLAVIGFIYGRTHDEAVASLHRQVVEQAAVLTDVYRSGGKAALDEAISDTLAYADPQTAVALLDGSGRELEGNLAAAPSVQLMQEGYRSAVIRLRGQPSPHQAEIVLSRLPAGQWLVSGRLVGEDLAFRATLERSLLLALAVAGLLGLLCGVILAHYVARRIGNIAAVANRISARDLSQRVPLSGAGDSFDRLGMQINAMLDRISTLMEELRLLTDSLAHDLRSPASRLRSAAHAAAEATDPTEQEELLNSVVRNADALIRILTTILEISRSEALTGRKQFAWFDVSELAAELAEMYDPVADERGASLHFDRPARPVPLFGHRQLLAQALSNLLENAIRYGSGGGKIDVRVQQGDKQIRLEVADRGPGIPLDRRDEALKRFGRLDSSRSDEGAGLGLALAKSIAHLHEGELLLDDNRPGLLTTLELPVHPPQPAR
ncbi:MAG TPA: HAMP domain-containing sensor histidine kinase [Sphingomicrobium sp.]|nr:HAMP domain-containing sensor histidine kinase [Sphingomicrobium sp.]